MTELSRSGTSTSMSFQIGRTMTFVPEGRSSSSEMVRSLVISSHGRRKIQERFERRSRRSTVQLMRHCGMGTPASSWPKIWI